MDVIFLVVVFAAGVVCGAWRAVGSCLAKLQALRGGGPGEERRGGGPGEEK